jgi:uncharacterized protein (TIGR02453 family)
MASAEPIFTRDTFRFFRELARNNKKVWMDANRQRYQQFVVQPFRRLLEELSPTVLRLDSRFDTTGRTGANFSRINRDIRFAKDKTPYRAQMYLKFSVPFPGGDETGQLYTGISANSVTVGFRIYVGSTRKASAIGVVADGKVTAKPRWLTQQKKTLGRKYESYWYALEKKEWTKQDGWPAGSDDWENLLGWIVRKKLQPAVATRATFPRDVEKTFRELFPLLKFTSLTD